MAVELPPKQTRQQGLSPAAEEEHTCQKAVHRAFQAVFHRSFGEIYGYVAYRLAAGWDAAQDVTQDAFLAAWQAWNSYRGDGMVVSWLRGIARRKVADHLRAKIRGRDSAKANGPTCLATSGRTPRTNDRSCWPRRRGCCPQSTWNCSKKSTLRGFPFDEWQRSGRERRSRSNRLFPEPATCSDALTTGFKRKRGVPQMKTFDFDRDEQIASALAEAVKAYSPPPGLQETVGERLFGRTGDSVSTLGANPDLDGSGSADPQAARLAVRPAGRSCVVWPATRRDWQSLPHRSFCWPSGPTTRTSGQTSPLPTCKQPFGGLRPLSRSSIVPRSLG